ncbi:MAG: hypothetical protein ACTHU0_14500, partial [Kofleriaceae bacterium]
MRVAFFLDGQLAYADRRGLPTLSAIVRSVARRVGADVTLRYDHAATLERGDGSEVHRAQWYDAREERFE